MDKILPILAESNSRRRMIRECQRAGISLDEAQDLIDQARSMMRRRDPSGRLMRLAPMALLAILRPE